MIKGTGEALERLAEAMDVLAGKAPPQPDQGDGEGSEQDAEQEVEDDAAGDDVDIPKALRPKPSKGAGLPSSIEAIIRDDQPADPDRAPGSPPTLVVDAPEYQIWPDVNDKIIKAETLHKTPAALQQSRQVLDELIGHDAVVSRLATKLLRVIMAQQTRAWSFDQEDGMLDPARLARIVSSPTLPAAYRIEHESKFKETAVTLLVDNSGSMAGEKIQVAAVVSDILARVLERCGVAVEVLGWTSKGAAHQPATTSKKYFNSRVDNLLHIIYKDANVPYRRTRDNYGVMVGPSGGGQDFLEQNVDGEALIWAYNRLVARPQPRRIMIVISDGEPASATNGSLLWNHLKKVIAEIEKRQDIELLAIGACHDVTRWYKHAVTVPNVAAVGAVMMTELTKLFDPAERRNRK